MISQFNFKIKYIERIINMNKQERNLRNRAAKKFMDNFEKQLDMAIQKTQTEKE